MKNMEFIIKNYFRSFPKVCQLITRFDLSIMHVFRFICYIYVYVVNMFEVCSCRLDWAVDRTRKVNYMRSVQHSVSTSELKFGQFLVHIYVIDINYIHIRSSFHHEITPNILYFAHKENIIHLESSYCVCSALDCRIWRKMKKRPSVRTHRYLHEFPEPQHSTKMSEPGADALAIQCGRTHYLADFCKVSES